MNSNGSAYGRIARYSLAGANQQVGLGLAVGVVVDALPEVAQRLHPVLGKTATAREFDSGLVEVVAESGDHRPQPVPALQVPVHQRAGAAAGRGVDVGTQTRVLRDRSGEMVIEILDLHAARQQTEQGLAVAVQGDVEHGDAVAGLGRHAIEQLDVALDAGHQHGRQRRRQAQLVQGADPVGIAIEDVVMAQGPQLPAGSEAGTSPAYRMPMKEQP